MKKVVLIGLGAVGLTYAVKLADKCDLSVLVDEERLKRYKANKPVFNGVEQIFKYVLPTANLQTSSLLADVIIISTKSQGLESAISSIKNFVTEGTRIISLINGISSEERISKEFPQARVLKSYFIGHSAVRNGNSVTQDGVGEIVIEHDDFIEEFFNEVGIQYSAPEDIDYSMWLKFTFNSFANPLSAILNMTFGELKQNKMFLETSKKIIFEIYQIAKKKGINNIENLQEDSLNALSRMCDEGRTSMHQDILAKRSTEIDIFAGEVIKMGQRFGIPTPYNQMLYDLIKIKEEYNEHSVYTC